MIALLGATGYTGRLVAAELARRQLPHRLGGRSPDRLASLTVPASADVVEVDATDPAGLDAFLRGATALISCVGPFAALGMPVVEAAVRNRVPYVDSTGEPDFMRAVYDRFTDDVDVPLVPACGFDYIPGDLAAAVAAADLGGTVEQIIVAYELSGMAPSRGTARSAVGAMRSARVAPRSHRVRFPAGSKDVVEIPWGEQLTVPRHVPKATVASGVVMPPVVGSVLGVLGGAARLVAPVAERLVDLLPEGPTEGRRRQSRFTVVAEARGGGRTASVVCEGSDIYGLTARFLVEAATAVGGAGALTPAQALDPVPFLEAVSGEGPTGAFSWRRL